VKKIQIFTIVSQNVGHYYTMTAASLSGQYSFMLNKFFSVPVAALLAVQVWVDWLKGQIPCNNAKQNFKQGVVADCHVADKDGGFDSVSGYLDLTAFAEVQMFQGLVKGKYSHSKGIEAETADSLFAGRDKEGELKGVPQVTVRCAD